MPKQIYKIEQFHGGLNSNSDPRDIADNELSGATDIMVDELGRIRMMGGITSSVTANTANLIAGRGLLYFSHDRQDAHDGEATSSTSAGESIAGDDYLVLCDKGGTGHDIYSRDEDTWGTAKITGNMNLPTYVIVDGAVRISDGDFNLTDGSGRYNRWYGYVQRGNFPSTNLSGLYDASSNPDGHQYNQWWVEVANYVVPPTSNIAIDTAVVNGDLVSESISLQVGKQPLGSTIISACDTINGWTAANDGTADPLEAIDRYVNEIIYLTSTGCIALEGNASYGTTDDTPISLEFDFSGGDPVTSAFDFSDKSIYFSLFISSAAIQDDIDHLEVRVRSSDNNYAEYIVATGDLRSGVTVDNWNETIELQEGNHTKLYGTFDKTAITEIDFMFHLVTGQTMDFGDEPLVPAIAVDNIYHHVQGLSTTVGDWDGQYRFYYSYIYDEKQESLLTEFTGDDFKSDDMQSAYFTVFYHNPASTAAPKPRRTGANIYASKKSSDGSGVESDRFLILECDWIKGVKIAGTSAYSIWKDASGLTATTVQSTAELTSNIKGFETFESLNGYSASVPNNSHVQGGGFRTAVVANRMLYTANLCYGPGADKRVTSDAMFKSSVNKFDLVIPERRIEVAVDDGDEIIKLETYADRLLQFKKRKMYLINISQELEFLEDTFNHKGVLHYSATCITDYGIAWVNRLGCYLYDGQKVNNLLEKGGRQIIKESEWDSFTTDNSIIGYVPKKRQLIVLKNCKGTFVLSGSIDVTGTNTDVPGTSTKYLTELFVGDEILVTGETRTIATITDDTTATVTVAWGSNLADDASPECIPADSGGDIYLYDMVTQSWVFGNSKFTDSQIQSNFVNDWNGDLVHAHTDGTGNIFKWSDAGVASSGVSIITKDFDFGQPGQRKKIYKVYVTYKGSSDTNVDVFFDVDGGTSLNKTFQDGTNFSSSQLTASASWAVAELKPTTSSEANNKKSFRLKFVSNGSTASDFAINDISIVYRLKSVK